MTDTILALLTILFTMITYDLWINVDEVSDGWLDGSKR